MSVLVVPKYTVDFVQDGERETVQLQVSLPGVKDSSEIVFTIESEQHLRVHVPGRYRADISLSVPVEGKAESVQFLRMKALLKATLLVAEGEGSPAASSSTPWQQQWRAEGSSSGDGWTGQGSSAAAPQPATPGVHPAQQQQRPSQQQQQQQQEAAAGASPASPREQQDADMYAAARQHSNREAAAECYQKAKQAERGGDLQRAQRLLHKACQLDASNTRYASDLLLVVALLSAEGAATAGHGGETAAGSGGDAAAHSPAGPAPQHASSPQQQPQSQRRRNSQQRDCQQQQQASPQQRPGQRPPPSQQQQPPQPQQQARPQPPEAAAAPGGARATRAGAKLKAARRQWLRIFLAAAVSLCVLLAAVYGLYRLAPPAAPAAAAGADAGVKAASGWLSYIARLAAPVLFLPRVLLWRPTWTVAGLWAVAGGSACTLLRAADQAQRQRGKPDAVPADVYAMGIMALWHPLLWCACGGRWGALLGTLGEFLPITRLFGNSFVVGHVVLYPLACMALRIAGGWLLPWLLPLAAPLLWLLRHAAWRPRWWLSFPLVAAFYLAYEHANQQRRRARSSPLGAAFWFQCTWFVAVWWLSGGGWWAVAHTAVMVGMDVVLAAASARRPSLFFRLTPHLLYAPAPIFVAKGLAAVWYWDSLFHALLGIAAAGLLYSHIKRHEGPEPDFGGGGGGSSSRQQGGHDPASLSGTRHLHNTAPPGAPEAVTRILKAANYYEVLGVAGDADEAAIKRAKRTLSLATHPDKIGEAPGASEAFNLVTEASEVLGDAATRQQYDAEMADASLSAQFSGLSPEDMEDMGIPPEFAERVAEFVEACEAGDIPQRCDHCGGVHFLRRTDRPVHAARQCDECCTRHPVKNNEVWFESSSAGFMRRQLHMYCCYKGVVYNMSEGGDCDGTLRTVHSRGVPLNKHINFFRGFGLASGGGSSSAGAAGGGGGGAGGRGRRGGQAGPGGPRGQGPKGAGGKKKSRRR